LAKTIAQVYIFKVSLRIQTFVLPLTNYFNFRRNTNI